MRFGISDIHKEIREMARDFAENYLKKNVIERDIEARFPAEEVKKMGELGLLGMLVPEEYGGINAGNLAYVNALEEICRVDAGVGTIMSVQNSLINYAILTFGREEHKREYLPRLATGEILGAYCLSEAEAGSDAANQKTTAIKKGDRYILNGTKIWITTGGHADIFIVFAQSNPSLKHRGINAFIVERGWKGVIIGKKEDKMGIRTSDTHTIIFEDVEVPEDMRLGNEGDGFKIAMQILDGGRIGIGSQAVGIAQGAFDIAASYATQRKTFGVPIIEHQAIALKLAEMICRIEAARLLLHEAAYLRDCGKPHSVNASMAKYYASETAMYVTTEAVQILGGYGYVREYHVERMMRDAKITQIYEGTSEIQQLVISRHIAKSD